MKITQPRPTRADLLAATGKTVPDVIAPGLRVLFVGINPGLYSAAIGHHFGKPGNRFWRALHTAGFTPRQFAPCEERELLTWGLGITNLVARATARADELAQSELIEGRHLLEEKTRAFAPRWVAVLGMGAYRTAFQRPEASVGLQNTLLGGARVWLLPNPSGLNAHYQPADLAAAFRAFRLVMAGDLP